MYLTGTTEDMHAPTLLEGAEHLTDILMEKIEQSKSIRIVGDYDIDGICSTTILYKVLKYLGAQVDYCIPHRITDGYGINDRIVEDAKREGIDTIITCDNGIAAFPAMELAKSYGMTVLITDHHQPYTDDKGQLLPSADVVVNPHQTGCKYPFKNICGAMVVYKLMCLLLQKMDAFYEEPDELTVLAAIATVGDIMPLIDENRILVKEGLRLMSSTNNPGLAALIECCGIDRSRISAYSIGFQIGPCLNASGRLESAGLSIELLLAADSDRAEQLAKELVELNNVRKDLTNKCIDEAISLAMEKYADDRVLVIHLEDCHESIAGIIAGRVREQVYKPVFIITNAENGLKGSGRSIEAYSMFEELQKCKELLTAFGGHPMAAGLSLPPENLDDLRQKLNDNATLGADDMIPVKWIDVPAPMSYISKDFVRSLTLLEPFGNGNSKPVFAQRSLSVRKATMVGAKLNVMKLVLADESGNTFACVKFNESIDNMPLPGQVINCTYYPTINEFRGVENLEFILEDIF